MKLLQDGTPPIAVSIIAHRWIDTAGTVITPSIRPYVDANGGIYT